MFSVGPISIPSTSEVNNIEVNSEGGESILQVSGLNLVVYKHYKALITATNNDAASRNFTITANGGDIALASFTLGGIDSSKTFDIDLHLNSTSAGVHYLAYEVDAINTVEDDDYSSSIVNLTSIELNASTAGSIGDNSFIKIISKIG